MLPTVSISLPSSVTPPVAGGTRITLMVDASDPDPDGSIDKYEWSANGGTFENATVEDATWIAPAEDPTEQTYRLILTVTDDRGGSTTVNIDIAVEAANKAPWVDITTGEATVGGGDRITLLADTGDDDGSVVSHLLDRHQYRRHGHRHDTQPQQRGH